MDALTPSAIRNSLRTRVLGCDIVYYEAVGSTNAMAKALALQGAQDGTLVIANVQTEGRGRLDRRWIAERGTSLLLSLILRPTLPTNLAQTVTMIAGLGIRDGIGSWPGLPVGLKWPNDVMVRGNKVGGILTEVSTSGKHLDYAIVGIGLNVNLDPATFPAEFRATSIQHELGHSVSRLRLLQTILWHVERRYARLCEGHLPTADWAAALETLGQQVCVQTSQGRWQGLASAVDDEGALLVSLADGHVRRVLVGDIVSPKREAPAARRSAGFHG